VQEETVKVTANQIIEIFKGYLYGLSKKELVTLADGVNAHDLASDFVRKFDFKDLPESNIEVVSDY
jgi:hypothetical protein